MSPTSHPFTWSRAERSGAPIHTAPPFPDQHGARLQVSQCLCGHWAQRRDSPLPLDASARPSRAYLSWRCKHRTTQLKSHLSASLPRVPAKRGARKPGGNKCVWISRRAGHGAAKLASGRRGRWLGSAGCCARGSRPARRPRPPRPQPAPHRGRRRRGARAPAPAAAAPASELGRERGARPLRQVALGAGIGFSCFARRAASTQEGGAEAATTGNTGAGVPGRAAKKETLKTPGAPSASRAPAQPSWPRHCRWLCFVAAVGGGCRSCHSSSPPRRRAGKPSRVGFFPRGNPDPGGATERAQPLPGKQLPGFAPATGRGGAMG